MATRSNTFAWKVLWTEEPDELQSMGLQSWTRLSDFSLSCGALGLQGTQASVVLAYRLSCSVACGIFPNQGLNLCLLHWWVDSFFFIYLFLAVMGLCCCEGLSSSYRQQELLFIAVHRLLIVVVSLLAEHGL